MLCNLPSGATVSDVLFLFDTGADIPLLPRIAVEQLGMPLLAGQRCELMSFDRNKRFASVVILHLLFMQRAFRGRSLLICEGFVAAQSAPSS